MPTNLLSDNLFAKPDRCDRCHAHTTVTTMSIFNVDMICPECEAKEKTHPKYQMAKAAEFQAVKNGNYNFPGIGKPDDL